MSNNRFNIDLCKFFAMETEEHIVILDAESKPLMIFPLAGRNRLFVREYVAGMFKFCDTYFHAKSDLRGKFKKEFQALTGAKLYSLQVKKAWKAVEKLEE